MLDIKCSHTAPKELEVGDLCIYWDFHGFAHGALSLYYVVDCYAITARSDYTFIAKDGAY